MIGYDIIGGGSSDEYVEPLTLEEILKNLNNSTANSVRFWGTEYTVGRLCSWRGSYELPSLTYETGYKSPSEVAKEIEAALKEVHHGWKGGEYNFYEHQCPYVSARGCSEEYMIVAVEESDGILYLCTKIIPY